MTPREKKPSGDSLLPKEGDSEVKILRKFLAMIKGEIDVAQDQDYDTDDLVHLIYGTVVTAIIRADKAKDGPTEDDKKRLRSIISWLDNRNVRESVDKVTIALLWTVWELAKSWGIK